MTPRHAEVTKHIRKRLKAAGIAAKCAGYTSCGKQYVRISTPTYEAKFTDEQQRQILLIVQVNGLTRSCGMAIDLDQRTYENGAHFEFHEEA